MTSKFISIMLLIDSYDLTFTLKKSPTFYIIGFFD